MQPPTLHSEHDAHLQPLEPQKTTVEDFLRFETLLADLSAAFINAPAEEIDGKIEEAQRLIGEFLGADLSMLVQFSEDGKRFVGTHTWAREEPHPLPTDFDLSPFSWVTKKILARESIHYARVDDLPDDAASEKALLKRNGSRSGHMYPLVVGNTVIGALLFSVLRAERHWPCHLVRRLDLAGQVFAAVLARKQAEEALQQALAEIKRLNGKLEAENIYLRHTVHLKHDHARIVRQSQAMQRVLAQVEQVAATDATVLLLGETGTGKELLAQAVHELSRRKHRTLIEINCAALAPGLIESELFGHEKGAYTGAFTRQGGRFELADGSTLFLDEVGELPLGLQAKLLRVIEEGRFQRLGSGQTIQVDARIVAATNRNLAQAVREGRFREDLYYRLNVFPITVPPLRERSEDIAPLVSMFVQTLGERMGKVVESIPRSSLEALARYTWPGNVRELRNVVERALILSQGPVLRLEAPQEEAAAPDGMTLEDVERQHILCVLEQTRWRVRGARGAAEILGLKPSTLESKMAKLGLQRPS